MADSLRKQIVDALVTVLGAMSTATGFNLEWERNGGAQKVLNVNPTVELPTVVVSYADEDKGEEFTSFYRARLELQCAGIIAWSEDDGLAIEDVTDDAAFDIERALMLEMKNDPILGIDAIERIQVLGHTKLQTDSNHLVAMVRCIVQYRHNSFDPGVYP